MKLPGANFNSSFMLRELDSGTQRGIEHPLAEYTEATRHMARWWVRKSSGSGESMADLCQRLNIFLQQLSDSSAGLRVLLVCHGQVMRAFKALLEGVNVSDGVSSYDSLLDEEVVNCTIKWYTRREGIGNIHRRLWKCTQYVLKGADEVREDTECTTSEVPILFQRMTSDQLLARVESKPQLINTADYIRECGEPQAKRAKTCESDPASERTKALGGRTMTD